MVSMSGCCTLFSIPQAILMYILYVGDWSQWKENHHIPWNQPELGKGAQFTRRPAVQHWHWTWPFVICFPFIFKFFCTSVTYNSLAALTVQIWIRRMFVSSAITQALFHCLKLFFFSLFFVSFSAPFWDGSSLSSLMVILLLTVSVWIFSSSLPKYM